MIQKNYLIKTPLMAGSAITDITGILKTTRYKDALLNIYEAGFPLVAIKPLIRSLRTANPKLKIAGISALAIADMPPNGIGLRLNLILTEESDIEVVDLPCQPGQELEAARTLDAKLKEKGNARAVELLVSNMTLNMTRFLEVAGRDNEDVIFFGTVTSAKMPNNLNVRAFNIEMQNFIKDLNLMEYSSVFGQGIMSDGIVCVIFSGDELEAHLKYALGWEPIGRKMDISLDDRDELGITCVSKIGGLKATDIYKEYLGVSPNEYLVNNVCEFPFITIRKGVKIGVIPFNYDDEGRLYFNIDIDEGEEFRFSFASKKGVLCESDRSNQAMALFKPEALFLVMCGNRINFLQDAAHYEWDNFKVNNPDLALVHGISEIAYRAGKGGVLNSAHVAIGLREHGGDRSHLTDDLEIQYDKQLNSNRQIPLQERMAVFLGKMTSELEDKVREAETANNAKSSFLSNMSHEIRTPINAILGMDEMILRESDSNTIISYAEDIRSASSTLLSLVNDILDFSKIESGKMDIIPVEYDFTSVINDVVNVVKKRAEDKNLKLIIEVDPDIPAVLYGDEIRLKQVITNILTNAIKYTEQGSVTLSITKLRDGKKLGCHDRYDMDSCFVNPLGIKVSVKDTGIGIKEEDLDRLGNAFERVDEKRNRTIEGTGLGLNITSRILHLMGSKLEVESSYGHGSDFHFYLEQGIVRDDPIGDINNRWERTSSESGAKRESFKAPNARILVVDDTKMNLDVIVNLLKRTKIKVDTALSGQECLDKVAKEYYDIIFLDHRMPNMDGIECLERMKELRNHKCPDSPVISLTANAISGAREEYLRAGFKDYLTKPIEPSKLEDMLLRYLPGELIIKTDASDDKVYKDYGLDDNPGADCQDTLDADADPRLNELRSVSDLDLESAIIYCGGKESFMSILRTFYDTIDDKTDEIDLYYNNKDWASYNIKVHAMKSSSRIIGLSRLSDISKDLEDASGEPIDPDTIMSDHNELIEGLREVRDALKPILDRDTDDMPDIPPEVLSDAYASLTEFVSAMDYELARMVLDSVSDYHLDEPNKERFDGLNKCLSKLDWDGMNDILKGVN